MKFPLLPTLAICALVALACAIFPEHALMLSGLGLLAAAVQGPITDRVRPYEVVRWEPNQLYTRTAATIKNNVGNAIVAGAIQAGFPLGKSGSQWETLNAGSESSVLGIFLGDDSQNIPEALAIAAITAAKYPILWRGPALINKSVIPLTDLQTLPGTYTLATIVSTMQAFNPPIDFLAEPVAAAIGTQTT